MCTVTCLILAALDLGGAFFQPPAEGKDKVNVLKTWNGSNSTVKVDTRYSITNPQEWNRVWKLAHGAQSDPPVLPEVDFSKHTVIAWFVGAKSSAGYAGEIKQLETKGNKVVVHLAVKEPKKGAAGAMMSAPFAMALVPKLDKVVEFRLSPTTQKK